jgi:DNA polymerase-3 subunit delta'
VALSDVLGHQSQARLISVSLLGDRPAHACLFAGPDGVGKFFFALQTAKLLLCGKAKGKDACDFCKSCRQADHDNHPDLRRVEAAEKKRFISLEQVQELCGQYALRPHGERRIAIVRDADRMTTEAANALLKTLEEPPAWGLLILTTSRPHALPDTILSRCQMLRFGPLPRADVVRVLSAAGDQPPEAVEFAANLADGSPGRALDLLECGAAELRDRLLERLRGYDSQQNFELATEALGADDQLSRRPLEEVRRTVRLALQLMLRYFRDVWSVQVGASDGRLFHADRAADIRAAAERLTPRATERAMDLLLRTWRQLDLNANPRLLLETAFFELGSVVGR